MCNSQPLLAAALSDGSARVTCPKGNENVATVICDGLGTLTTVNWAPDGLTLATTCGSGTTLLWDVRTWTCRSVLQGGHSKSCFGCVFHPTHNDLLVTWSSDGTISCWDTIQGEKIETTELESTTLKKKDNNDVCLEPQAKRQQFELPTSQPTPSDFDLPKPLTISSFPFETSFEKQGKSTSVIFPIYKCAMNQRGDQLIVAGGGGGKNSFLGTPVWVCNF
mmetsp:Transcript_35118/g.45289  ORF Transcript_35118/g.45289 Transcript_35118/m.45289 type:complete len:221 (+) Transcript_35118:750-1412(+)